MSIKFFCNRRKVNLGCCGSFTVSKSSLFVLYLISSTYHPLCCTFFPFFDVVIYCFSCELLLFFLALLYICCSLLSFQTAVLLCLPFPLLMLFVNLRNCCSLPSFCSCSLTFFCNFSRLTFHTNVVPFFPFILFFARHSFNTDVCSFLFSYFFVVPGFPFSSH